MEELNASQTLVLAIPTAVILSTASQENVLVIIFEAECVYISHVMCCLIVVLYSMESVGTVQEYISLEKTMVAIRFD